MMCLTAQPIIAKRALKLVRGKKRAYATLLSTVFDCIPEILRFRCPMPKMADHSNLQFFLCLSTCFDCASFG